MVRTLLLWLLVILVPVTNLRMICVDHAAGTDGRASASLSTECDEMCPRDGAPLPETDRPENGCLLVAGGCSSLASSVVALPNLSPLALTVPQATVFDGVPPALTYLGPADPPFAPPPEL